MKDWLEDNWFFLILIGFAIWLTLQVKYRGEHRQITQGLSEAQTGYYLACINSNKPQLDCYEQAIKVGANEHY